MTPVEELRAAATKLRETASKATPGPWQIRDGNKTSSNVAAMDYHLVIDGGGWTDGTKAVVYGAALTADAAWIALASPALAEPLAAWLEMTADWWDAFGIDPETDHPALTLARVINGDPR